MTWIPKQVPTEKISALTVQERIKQVSPVPGAEDIERKYQYWIDFGANEERERIIKIIEETCTYKEITLQDYLIRKITGESNG
jgi:hypothetical protein